MAAVVGGSNHLIRLRDQSKQRFLVCKTLFLWQIFKLTETQLRSHDRSFAVDGGISTVDSNYISVNLFELCIMHIEIVDERTSNYRTNTSPVSTYQLMQSKTRELFQL
jgi:hypothetical protein